MLKGCLQLVTARILWAKLRPVSVSQSGLLQTMNGWTMTSRNAIALPAVLRLKATTVTSAPTGPCHGRLNAKERNASASLVRHFHRAELESAHLHRIAPLHTRHCNNDKEVKLPPLAKLPPQQRQLRARHALTRSVYKGTFGAVSPGRRRSVTNWKD
jgi:hypothetical protein